MAPAKGFSLGAKVEGMNDSDISGLEGQIAVLGKRVKVLTALLVLLLMILGILGVKFASGQRRHAGTPHSKPSYQRFVLVSPESGVAPAHWFFALDTKTGRLCLTMRRNFESPFQGFSDLPLCSELYRDFPD